MSRMDKYSTLELENEETTAEEVVLSRVNKNQIMYDDVYYNRTRDYIDSIIEGEDTKLEKNPIKKVIPEEEYKEKSYSVNEFLEKAHENKSPDDAKRDIDDTAFREQEDEIRKLIASIDEKEEDADFFKDLKGENEDTLIGAKFKTDEFNESIYETLKDENLVDENSILGQVLGDKTVFNMAKEEADKMDHTFEEIFESDKKMRKKGKILPIIIFCSLLAILIAVVVYIVFIK